MTWQPIETAPLNKAGEFFGPTILIFYAADDLPWPSFWGPCPSAYGEGAWHSCDSHDDRIFDTDMVTHWMPLPEQPSGNSGELSK